LHIAFGSAPVPVATLVLLLRYRLPIGTFTLPTHTVVLPTFAVLCYSPYLVLVYCRFAVDFPLRYAHGYYAYAVLLSQLDSTFLLNFTRVAVTCCHAVLHGSTWVATTPRTLYYLYTVLPRFTWLCGSAFTGCTARSYVVVLHYRSPLPHYALGCCTALHRLLRGYAPHTYGCAHWFTPYRCHTPAVACRFCYGSHATAPHAATFACGLPGCGYGCGYVLRLPRFYLHVYCTWILHHFTATRFARDLPVAVVRVRLRYHTATLRYVTVLVVGYGLVTCSSATFACLPLVYWFGSFDAVARATLPLQFYLRYHRFNCRYRFAPFCRCGCTASGSIPRYATCRILLVIGLPIYDSPLPFCSVLRIHAYLLVLYAVYIPFVGLVAVCTVRDLVVAVCIHACPCVCGFTRFPAYLRFAAQRARFLPLPRLVLPRAVDTHTLPFTAAVGSPPQFPFWFCQFPDYIRLRILPHLHAQFRCSHAHTPLHAFTARAFWFTFVTRLRCRIAVRSCGYICTFTGSLPYTFI